MERKAPRSNSGFTSPRYLQAEAEGRRRAVIGSGLAGAILLLLSAASVIADARLSPADARTLHSPVHVLSLIVAVAAGYLLLDNCLRRARTNEDHEALGPVGEGDRYVGVALANEPGKTTSKRPWDSGFVCSEGDFLAFRGRYLGFRLPWSCVERVESSLQRGPFTGPSDDLFLRWREPDGERRYLRLDALDSVTGEGDWQAIDALAAWIDAEVGSHQGAGAEGAVWPPRRTLRLLLRTQTPVSLRWWEWMALVAVAMAIEFVALTFGQRLRSPLLMDVEVSASLWAALALRYAVIGRRSRRQALSLAARRQLEVDA